MNEKILAVAHILSDYGAYGASRDVTLAEMQKLGYSEQEAIFVLEILENCVEEFTCPLGVPFECEACGQWSSCRDSRKPCTRPYIPAPERTGEENPGDGHS